MDVALIGLDWDIIDLVESHSDFKLRGFIDIRDVSKDRGINDIPYLGTDKDIDEILSENPLLKLLITVNSPAQREKLFNLYGEERLATIRSPQSHLSTRALTGLGSIFQHGVKVMANARVGKGCLMNVNSAIHHESRLGDFSVMAPGSLVLGRVDIAERVYIGAGAIIKENCKIGANSIIGAGAVVVNDIGADSTVVGVPAKRFL